MSTASNSRQPIVLQLSRQLSERPTVTSETALRLRPFKEDADIDRWLILRSKAFAFERLGVRSWTRDDFQQEFLDKWWWAPTRLWFAELAEENGATPLQVGTVALADRGNEQNPRPVVHWLCVLPRYRRRGIAKQLMNTLESYCWERDWREIALETHVKWQRAVAFYRALGYREVDT